MGRDIGGISRRSARIAVAALLAASCLALLAAPASAAPTLTLSAPEAGARTNGTPIFSGTTTDSDILDAVKVLVYKGTSTGGTPVTFETSPAGSSWSAEVPSSEPLASGAHTVVVEQAELAGLFETGQTEPVTWTVDTEAPKVAITKGPAARSNETVPSFEGTASENTEVTVHVFEGPAEVAHVTTTAAGGKWSTETLSKALSTGKHTYRAFATEVSAIGNAPGESNPVEFEVDTEAPKVAITKGPKARSNETTPPFEGTASENTEVTVHIFEGSTPIATATTKASGGKWSTSTLTKALSTGSYRAFATEKSAIGNEPGESNEVTFQVDTEAPKVAITKGPEARSSDTTPSFSGTASENSEVIVHVFKSGVEVAKAKTVAAGGSWSTETLDKPLPTGNNKFTARATELSAIGNEPGESNTVEFEVDTEAPKVAITKGPEARSSDTTPSFSGTASENTEVTVHVFEGSTPIETA